MTAPPITAEEYQVALNEHRTAEDEWNSLLATEKQARLAVEAAREPYYAKCRAFHAVEKEWARQQPLTGTQRNWLERLREKPIWIGGRYGRESSKTEDRMLELGFAATNGERYLVVTELGKAKLAEAPVKKGRKK